MDFQKELEAKRQEVEAVIQSHMPVCSDKEAGKVYEAMEYSLLAGGKRLRPMFMSLFFSMFHGSAVTQLSYFMAAIEMIHTYSLVHDDLPAMDDDAWRRGRKTTHVVYGEAMAILAGDALLTEGLNLAAKAVLSCFDKEQEGGESRPATKGTGEMPVPELAERTAKCANILAAKAGAAGMIGGQVMDIEAEGKSLAIEELNLLNQRKTGALLEASMMIGAILAGASKEQIITVEKLAGEIGLAFQIQDDILDVTGDMEKLGKPLHSDAKNEKHTYVSIYGIEKAIEQVKQYSESAIRRLQSLSEKDSADLSLRETDMEFLQELIMALTERKY